MYAVVVANGEAPEAKSAREWLEGASIVIAADGGSLHCLALGHMPDVLIGDLDSVPEEELRVIEEQSRQIQRHPQRKDANDLELALDYALDAGHKNVVVLGAVGGRWDQTLTNWLLLAHPKYDAMSIQIVDARQTCQLVRSGNHLSLSGRPGDTVSLVPVGGDAVGVSTTGLEYPLKGETLAFASSRGVSNRLVEERAEIQLESGALLCLQLAAPGPSREG